MDILEKEFNLDHVYALILAGGGGTRLWPLSTEILPKQFLNLLGTDISLVETSVIRALYKLPSKRIFIQTSLSLQDKMKDLVTKYNIPTENVLAEPALADTAAAIGYGTISIHRRDKDALIAVLTADHKIEPQEEFWKNLSTALEAASKEPWIVCIGVAPTRNETGFGYQEPGKKTNYPGIVFLKSYIEKPPYSIRPAGNTELSPETIAEELISLGCHWNSGMFAFSTKTLLGCYQDVAPIYWQGLRKMLEAEPSQFDAIAQEVFQQFEIFKKQGSADHRLQAGKTSIDFIIMEPLGQGKSNKYRIASFFDTKFFWEDLGDLGESLRRVNSKLLNKEGNLVMNPSQTEVVCMNTRNCNILLQEGSQVKKVVVQDMKDIIVAVGSRTNAAVILPMNLAQNIKSLQDLLKVHEGTKAHVIGRGLENRGRGLTQAYKAGTSISLSSDDGLVTLIGLDKIQVTWKQEVIKVEKFPDEVVSA